MHTCRHRGNQLASLSSQQPDLNSLPESLGSAVTFQERLGNGRFLKSIKCTNEDGELVVKIYVKRDPTISLSSHDEMLSEVRQRLTLTGAPNVMPFRWFKETAHTAYLVRQYFHSNLLERTTTPPFLTPVEKRWLSFQLLQALQQCHAAGMCHGDVKAENVMVTSWNWLFLVDFANFKPSVRDQRRRPRTAHARTADTHARTHARTAYPHARTHSVHTLCIQARTHT